MNSVKNYLYMHIKNVFVEKTQVRNINVKAKYFAIILKIIKYIKCNKSILLYRCDIYINEDFNTLIK